MKNLNKLNTLLLIVCVLVLTGCGGGPSAEEVMLGKLKTHPWILNNALVDGVDKTSLYTGLTITFNKGSFTASNGLPIWSSTGTWEFADNKAKTIIRNDDLEIEILEISSTTLKLEFNWSNSTFEPGRLASVAGDHIFTFGD